MKALIYHKKKKIIIAENWDEINARQFIQLAGLIHSGMTDAELACDKALKILSGKNLLRFLFIPADVRMRCWDHVEWVFEEQCITRQLIPKYKGLYGPEAEFNNLQMAEFHHAGMAYHRLIKEQDEDALDELVAIIYREPRKNYDTVRNPEGDIRIPFSFGDVAWHKKKVKRWPLNVKQAIVMWYDGCRQMLVKDYPTAFAGGTDSSSNYFDGMFGLIRNIAAGNKYGDFEKVEKMYVHTAFREIVESIEEGKELERRMKLQH